VDVANERLIFACAGMVVPDAAPVAQSATAAEAAAAEQPHHHHHHHHHHKRSLLELGPGLQNSELPSGWSVSHTRLAALPLFSPAQ
jgi:hypothetical protein